MVKSATDRIIKASSKLDLQDWLAGGKPRTRTVFISNDPNLVGEVDELATRMNELADRIEAASSDEDTSFGIADDPVGDLRAEWEALNAQYQVLRAQYDESLLPFTFRGQKPADLDEIKAGLKADGIPRPSNEQLGLGMVAHLCIDPVLSYQQLKDALEVLGSTAFLQMNDAIVELAQKRKDPAAPLSLRP